MGQWGRFLQIKHEAYPEPLNYTVSVSVRCWWVESVCVGGRGAGDVIYYSLQIGYSLDNLVETMKGNLVTYFFLTK